MAGVMSQQECVEVLSDLDETQSDEFTQQERERLARLKRAVARGERSDRYPVDKRQDFVRWLITQGKLSEN
jgi:hypothetical protein